MTYGHKDQEHKAVFDCLAMLKNVLEPHCILAVLIKFV